MLVKTIVHIDMDAFFASVEQADNPALKGKPVVIGADPKHGKGRGVVSTCSYEARKFGIHSAMPISAAYQKCPHAIFLPGRMSRYREISDHVFRILYDFTPDIEPISIDEAFLDITGTRRLHGTAVKTCLKIKERINKETGLTASVGIAPIKMAAKIASDLCKPDGILEIKKDKMLDFLWPLPIEKLWGVGPKTKIYLNKLGIQTIKDLAKHSRQELCQKLGESGDHFYYLANGIDPRGVELEGETKSVSHEHTFEIDTKDKEVLYKILLYLSEKVSRRLRLEGLKGKTVTIKVRYEGFQTYTRAATLGFSTNFVDNIYQKAKELFEGFYSASNKVRLIGVKVSNFKNLYVQENLFEDQTDKKKECIHKAVDSIKDKYGEKSIHRAA
ncbi:MAG: DNA polymerase IV [Candidatus Omnitrophica bacterium]|nr:DNA polymerase IV [Candidatus Omnitrophota bacterium]